MSDDLKERLKAAASGLRHAVCQSEDNVSGPAVRARDALLEASERLAGVEGQLFDAYADLLAAGDARQAAEAHLAKAREALTLAAITFREYEQLHLAKGTQDADEKAHRNHDLAATMEAALATAKPETEG